MRNDKRSLSLSLPLPLSLSLFPVSLFHLTHSRVCSQSLHSLFSNSFGNIFLSQSSFFLSLFILSLFLLLFFSLSLSLSFFLFISTSLSTSFSLLLSLYFFVSLFHSLSNAACHEHPKNSFKRFGCVCVCVEDVTKELKDFLCTKIVGHYN